MPSTAGRHFKKESNIVKFFNKKKPDENSNTLSPVVETEKNLSENERKNV